MRQELERGRYMTIGLSQETPWKGEEEPERFLELLRVIAASLMRKQAGSSSAWRVWLV